MYPTLPDSCAAIKISSISSLPFVQPLVPPLPVARCRRLPVGCWLLDTYAVVTHLVGALLLLLVLAWCLLGWVLAAQGPPARLELRRLACLVGPFGAAVDVAVLLLLLLCLRR